MGIDNESGGWCTSFFQRTIMYSVLLFLFILLVWLFFVRPMSSPSFAMSGIITLDPKLVVPLIDKAFGVLNYYSVFWLWIIVGFILFGMWNQLVFHSYRVIARRREPSEADIKCWAKSVIAVFFFSLIMLWRFVVKMDGLFEDFKINTTLSEQQSLTELDKLLKLIEKLNATKP